ncbi:uncharacterized protein BO87DRAFT_376947 [Aspergillus neoniger CBS 115656]|uniref:Uncharacterized protein n=1 Tax=Aspergillus neoniger (strain CBS 115656) TaxID=1448310 RepID=A0A318ZB53_ASPNB|nr:hypothetical protein BO87DRAFT_376947 [Aspergillus neoniger CBS 115656]PYH33662.1 hypothetical protein BO87DRAFT_376947 [Aspergillus neoniger CBS 115656]
MIRSYNRKHQPSNWLLILPLYGKDAPSNDNEAVIWLLSLRRTSVNIRTRRVFFVTPAATVSVTALAFSLLALRDQGY